MAEKKHTAGPWSIQFGGLDGDTSFTITSKIAAAAVADYAMAAPRDWREVQANARLIAAAPELLEACKLFLSKCRCVDIQHHGFGRAFDAAAAAVRKAEGRDAARPELESNK